MSLNPCVWQFCGLSRPSLEVFFYGGRQVIVMGEHPSSGGSYFWPDGLGPEAISAPPNSWWQYARDLAAKTQHNISAGGKHSSTRNPTRRLDPCPICGRHSRNGNGLWCEETSNGLIFCMPGSTFNADPSGSMKLGSVVNGYALVKRTTRHGFDYLTFAPNRYRRHRHFRSTSYLSTERRRATVDEWSNQIEALKAKGCSWRSGSPDDAKNITSLVKEIGCDPELDPHQQDWLLDCMKSVLDAPKGVLRELMKETAARAFPPAPLPEGCIEATPQPIDLQIAQLINKEHNNLIAERAWSLFRYAEELGFWTVWPDTTAKKASQVAAQRFASETKEGWCLPFGSATHVKAAVEQPKVMTTDGPLAADHAPAVIVFRNGTFNLQTSQLESHNPVNGATYGVAAKYIASAQCPEELGRVISTCYPNGSRSIIRAIIRWTVDPTVRYGEAFHIIGPSGSGKGLLIDFCRSLLPLSVVGQLRHPSDISGPEKLHQYVVGRRLVAFPDTPSVLSTRDGDSCNLFYELVENKPVTTRKLFAGESEVSRPMNCRFILGSVRPLNFKDGRDGYLRRVIALHTLPREGTTDTTLRDALNECSARYDDIRAEAISWALAMTMKDVIAVLNREDPEGLLRDAANESAINSDTISQWADQCLTSADAHPDMPVGTLSWSEMYNCYIGWCRYEGVNSKYHAKRTNFMGQVRIILGPKRCIDRKRASREDALLYGVSEREQLPRLDVGFMLRPGIMTQVSIGVGTWPTPESFNPNKMSSGGMHEIARLPQGKRTPIPDLGKGIDTGQ